MSQSFLHFNNLAPTAFQHSQTQSIIMMFPSHSSDKSMSSSIRYPSPRERLPAPLGFRSSVTHNLNQVARLLLIEKCTIPDLGAQYSIRWRAHCDNIRKAAITISKCSAPAPTTLMATEDLAFSWGIMVQEVANLTKLHESVRRTETIHDISVFRTTLLHYLEDSAEGIEAACVVMMAEVEKVESRKKAFPEWYQRVSSGTNLQTRFVSFKEEQDNLWTGYP